MPVNRYDLINFCQGYWIADFYNSDWDDITKEEYVKRIKEAIYSDYPSVYMAGTNDKQPIVKEALKECGFELIHEAESTWTKGMNAQVWMFRKRTEKAEERKERERKERERKELEQAVADSFLQR